MKFEKDFDFESANAQFNKEEIDREFQDKLKLKGGFVADPPPLGFSTVRCDGRRRSECLSRRQKDGEA